MAAGSAALFPIVGVGASAGGVEALESFFRQIPPDSGCAFVVVTHLSPDRPSVLPEIIGRFTAMPVQPAADGLEIRPNHVYVLAVDASVGVKDGRLQVSRPPPRKRERKPIDVFLATLAKDRGDYAAGVILSGGDGDGTLGIKAIKERGGLTLAQTADGGGPRHPDMPDSAIASGLVDFAVPVKDMGERLAEFARGLAAGESISPRAARTARQEIHAILRNQLGHDFSGYKDATVLRRVQRRMTVTRLETVEAYLERLRRDPKEVAALFRDLLINVTNFFRDADAFKLLETEVIPKLFEGRGADESVRVWVPGCATGEEVFSIAILLCEYMEKLSEPPRVQVFATDIDEAALSVARAARYPEALLDSVTPERRKRFFVKEDSSYILNRDVRDLCVFSPHSVIRDPPFSRLDLISCRNLLIYFGAEVQNQVIPTFHYALRPGGYLFLGTSENVSQFADLFTPIDKKHRIFRGREDAAGRVRLPLAISSLRPSPDTSGPAGRHLAGAGLARAVEAHVLDRVAPPHVVVNRDGEVVYYSPRTGKYLEATPGAPSRQLLTMARKGLRLDLRALLKEAIETGRRAIRERSLVDTDDDRVQRLAVSVEPLGGGATDGRLYLVVFTDTGPPVSREDAGPYSTPPEASAELEHELRETRERLQSLIEEYETALEELRSSNEELVSVNEELQSTNEELEASKEELQSVNEELHTVNGQLNSKIEELDRANSDLTNLFESSKVATIFLDRDLVIRTFTPAASQIFGIRTSDRGRPLTDLASRVVLPNLMEDVKTVIETGEAVERPVSGDGTPTAHYLLRLVAYRDSDSRVDGVVLTFVDITTLTQSEAQQRVLIAELNHRVKNMLMVVISVAEQTFRTSPDSSAFKERLIERILGMSRSYELVSRENWNETSLDDTIRPHLEAFGLERIMLEGPDVRLQPAQALALGMIVHELATNAGKYGAMSQPSGAVRVTWERQAEPEGPRVKLLWREEGGPEVVAPKRAGFGLKLVKEQAVRGLGGAAEVEFAPSGLAASITFPLRSG